MEDSKHTPETWLLATRHTLVQPPPDRDAMLVRLFGKDVEATEASYWRARGWTRMGYIETMPVGEPQ